MVGFTPRHLGVDTLAFETFDVYNHLALDPYNSKHLLSADTIKQRIRRVLLALHPDKLEERSIPPRIDTRKLIEFKQYVWTASSDQLIQTVDDINGRAKWRWVGTWKLENTDGKWKPVRFPATTSGFDNFNTEPQTPRASRPYPQPGSGEGFKAGYSGASSPRPTSYAYSGAERFNTRARSASPRRSPSSSQQQYRTRQDKRNNGDSAPRGAPRGGGSAAAGVPVDDDEDGVTNGPVPISDDDEDEDDDCSLIDPAPMVQTGRYITELSMPIPATPAKFRYLFSLTQLIQMGISMGWTKNRGRGEAIRVVIGVVRRNGEDRLLSFPEYVVTAGVKGPTASCFQIRVRRWALNGRQLPQYGDTAHASAITRCTVNERGYMFPPFDTASDKDLLIMLQQVSTQYNAYEAENKHREQAAEAKAAKEKKAAKAKAAREKAARKAREKQAREKQDRERQKKQGRRGNSIFTDYFGGESDDSFREEMGDREEMEDDW